MVRAPLPRVGPGTRVRPRETSRGTGVERQMSIKRKGLMHHFTAAFTKVYGGRSYVRGRVRWDQVERVRNGVSTGEREIGERESFYGTQRVRGPTWVDLGEWTSSLGKGKVWRDRRRSGWGRTFVTILGRRKYFGGGQWIEPHSEESDLSEMTAGPTIKVNK